MKIAIQINSIETSRIVIKKKNEDRFNKDRDRLQEVKSRPIQLLDRR